MADRYWARLEFPAASMDAEVRAALEAEGVDLDNLDPSGSCDDYACIEKGIFTLEDCQARYGQFEDLENTLVLKKIPFDRESAGYCEFIPELRVYRPEMDRDMTFLLCDGEPVVSVEMVRSQLRVGAFALEAYLNEAFPAYPPLVAYVQAKGGSEA